MFAMEAIRRCIDFSGHTTELNFYIIYREQFPGLNEFLVWQYREEGYLVLEGFLSPEECDALRERTSEIVERMDVPAHCRTQFSTDHDEQLKSQVH